MNDHEKTLKSDPKTTSTKIVTWNVNSVGVRLDRLIAMLKRHKPDVVCLQELKCIEAKFPFAEIKEAGYSAFVFGQKAYNGVAILCLEEPDQVFKGFDDGVEDEAARFIGIRQKNGQIIASLYCPNGQSIGSEKYAYKLKWFERLKEFLMRTFTPDLPMILAGDFNVAPTDQDIADPEARKNEILCSPHEREALKEVLSFGLFDAARELDNFSSQFTWWDYRSGSFQRNQGLRIDLFLVTKQILASSIRSFVDRDERKGDKPSDHAPVVLEIGR